MDADIVPTLDEDQKIDARQMIGCGWRIPDVATHYGLTELQLREQLGLPQFKSEPPQRKRPALFDDGGAE